MASRDLEIGPGITIPGWALTENFVLAGGPGGQNVNKVSTAVQLRFSAVSVQNLFSNTQFQQLKSLSGNRFTKSGEILIESARFRGQDRNREDARERLRDLILKALEPPPPPRKRTRPTRGSIERRLKDKAGRGRLKKDRQKVGDQD